MILSVVRTKDDLLPVLVDPQASVTSPLYLVFKEVSQDKWENLTLTMPGKVGKEFFKTFGHYHPEDAPVETYRLLYGQGIFQLQKKFVEDGKIVSNKVAEVVFIRPQVNDEIKIPNDWAHSWTNIGEGPLLTLDDWRTGHTPQDYEIIKNKAGLAYYVMENNGQVEYVPNSNYIDLPKPRSLTAQEFNNLNN